MGRSLLPVVLLVTTGLITATLAFLGSTTPNNTPSLLKSASSSRQHFPLQISPDPISLGRLAMGEIGECSFSVFNPLPEWLYIERVETSCHCLTVATIPMRIAAGERKFLAVRYDASEEPDFHGGLSVDVAGFDAAGNVAFRTSVELEVGPNGATGAGRLTIRAEPKRRGSAT